MIYMTHCETLCTTEKTTYTDIAFPQSVHIVKDTFRRAKSGLFYPPHKASTKQQLAMMILVLEEENIQLKLMLQQSEIARRLEQKDWIRDTQRMMTSVSLN